MKSIIRIITLFIVCNLYLISQELNLNEFLTKAKSVNPEIKNLKSVIVSKEYAVKQAGKKINPVLELEAGNKEQLLGFFQDIEYPGKIDSRISIAKVEGEIADLNLRKYIRGLENALTSEYIEWYYSIEKQKIFEEYKNLISGIYSLSAYNYNQGFGNKLDLLKSKIELNKANRFSAEAEKNSSQFLNKIIQSLQYSKTGLELFPSKVELKDYLDLQECYSLAELNNPDLQDSKLKIKLANIQKENVKLSSRPDFNLGLSAGLEDGKYVASLKFGMPLNLWDSKEDALKESEYLTKGAEHESEVQLLNIKKEVSDAFIETDKYRQLIMLFENELLVETEEVFTGAKKMYESGELKMIDFLDAERTYLEVKLEYIETKKSMDLSKLRLYSAIGLSITGN